MFDILGGVVNKRGYDKQAEQERQAGIANLARIKREGRTIEGAMIVAFGKSGLTMEGSPMDAIGQNAYNMAMDEYTTKFNTASRVASAKEKGRAALLGGLIKAGATLASESAKPAPTP